MSVITSIACLLTKHQAGNYRDESDDYIKIINSVGHCNICRAQYSPRPIHQLLCVFYSHVHLTMGVYIKQ